jgi:hypothetical protein
MPSGLPKPLTEVAELQGGIVTRAQARSAGLSDEMIKFHLHRGRWRRVHTSVYAIFSGPLDRQATLWAAVLRAGRDAALSHHSAAELDGLIDKLAPAIHVTIPATRRVRPIPGVVIHSSVGVEQATHPARLPPRTRIEETVLDLAESSGDLTDAVAWITLALSRRLTKQDLLRGAMDRRSRFPWRADLDLLLSPDGDGIQSLLEYRYFRYVERPHGLPAGRRQARALENGRRRYRDVHYDDFGVVVELDGRVAHPAEARWRDIHRDNATAASGSITLRYGHGDLTATPCVVAVQVGQVCTLRGWRGSLRPCSPSCPVRQS